MKLTGWTNLCGGLLLSGVVVMSMLAPAATMPAFAQSAQDTQSDATTGPAEVMPEDPGPGDEDPTEVNEEESETGTDEHELSPTERPAPTLPPAPGPGEDEEEELDTEALTDAPSAPMRAASPMAAGAWREAPNQRLSGSDRYATTAAITKRTYPKTADTVILANGLDFPDSLSAAALSAKLGAPMLLTAPGSIPAVTAGELDRLRPKRILLIGGTGVVSKSVETAAKRRAKSVVRLGGADRYETAVAISKFGWSSSSEVFVATGTGYADALAAAAAAGTLKAPVLLVPGTAASAPQSVTRELTRLKVKSVRIAGGTGAVSSAMQRSIATNRSVTRYAGEDRYDTAARIARGVYKPGVSSSYWASGMGFADALAGAAAAGARGGVLLLVRDSCVPSVSYSAHDALVPAETFLLGGTGVLKNAVRNGDECMVRPTGISNSDWSSTQRLYAKLNSARYDRGLSGLRVSDSVRGTPARSWASKIGSGSAKQQSSLATGQPWVRYQSAAVVKGQANRADRAFSLLQANAGGARWIYQPGGGARVYVSVGFATVGNQSNVVLFLGSGLNPK